MSTASLAFRLLGIDSSASDRLDDVADRADGAAERLGALGKAGALAGGLLAGSFGAGLVSALDVEPALDQLAGDLSATGADAQRFGAAAGDLYASAYGENIGAVTDAVALVAQNIGGMGDASAAELEKVGGAALDVAKTMREDVGPVTVAVGQMMKTGLAANAEEAFDLLTRGQQVGLNKSQDLLDTLNEYGTQFRKLGLDGQTAMGLISQGLQGGARDADTVADALKEFGIRALDGSRLTGEGFRALGLDAGRMAAQIAAGGPAASAALDLTLDRLRAIEDPLQRDQAGVALFGSLWENMGAALSALDVSTATAQLGDVDGAAARMGETVNDNAKTHLTAFKRQAEMALVNLLGGRVVPAITEATGWLSQHFGPAVEGVGGGLSKAGDVVQRFAGWVSANEDPVKAMSAVLMFGLAPALGVTGTRATVSATQQVAAFAAAKAAAVGSAATQFRSLTATGLRWAWAGATALAHAARMAAAWFIALGPIGWAVAAVAAVVVLVVKYWDQIKGATVAAWNAVYGAIRSAVGAVVGWVRDHWRLLITILGGPIGAAVAVITRHWGSIKSGAVGAFNFIKGLPGSAGRALAGLGGILSAPFRAGFNAISRSWNSTVGRFSFKIPSWVPGVGGRGWGFPKMPQLFAGGVVRRAGMALVGDRGPELLHLPRGAAVSPLPPGGAGGGGPVANVTVNGVVGSRREVIAWVRQGIKDALRDEGKHAAAEAV